MVLEQEPETLPTVRRQVPSLDRIHNSQWSNREHLIHVVLQLLHRCALIPFPAPRRHPEPPRNHVTTARFPEPTDNPGDPAKISEAAISKQEIESTRELPSFEGRRRKPEPSPLAKPPATTANYTRLPESAKRIRSHNMFRAPLRRLRPASLPAARVAVPRRAASTASGPAKKGTWKGAAARWGVAGAAVYWYCTSPLFADDPARG